MGPRSRVAARGAAGPEAGPGQLRLKVQACGVCRTDLHLLDGEVASRSGRGSWAIRSSASPKAGDVSACRGWAGPAASARTAERPREPVSARPLHRLRHRRRVRRVRRGRRALLLPDPRRLPRRAGRAAVVRRADRLSRAAHVRRRGERSASTASAPPRISSPRSRATQGRRVLRVHAAGRRGGAGLRPRLGAVGGTRERRRSRWTPRSSSPRGELVPPRSRPSPRAARRLRRHPHERHPGFPYELLWQERAVRSVANLTRRDGEEFLALAPTIPYHAVTRYRLERHGRRWRTCAPGGSPARRSSCPKRPRRALRSRTRTCRRPRRA